MIDTSGYRRFERVDAVEETERGLQAALHGERLRIEVVRDDVVRFKISRGGVFDETPTFAVCVDPLASRSSSRSSATPTRSRVRTAALVVTLGLDPFRLDVHRTDGSLVVESAFDDDGRPGLRHAQRRLRGPPPLPAGGRDLRARREDRARTTARAATSRSGTPTCSTRTRRREFIAGRDATIRARTGEHRVRPVLRLDPVLLPPRPHRRDDGRPSFVDNGYRGALRLPRRRRVRVPLRGRAVHGVRLRRARRCRRSSRPTRG